MLRILLLTQATVDAIALLATLSGSSEEEKISAAFRAYDKDGNGFISQQVRSTAGSISEGIGAELLVFVPPGYGVIPDLSVPCIFLYAQR